AKQYCRASSHSLATSSCVAFGLSKVWSTACAIVEQFLVGWQTATRSAPRLCRSEAVHFETGSQCGQPGPWVWSDSESPATSTGRELLTPEYAGMPGAALKKTLPAVPIV